MDFSKQYICCLLIYGFKFGESAIVSSCRINAVFGDVPCSEPNEVRKRRGLKESCRPTCDNRNFTELCDEPMDLSFVCECKPGYILDEAFGKCIPIEECKTENSSSEATTERTGSTETSEATETPETEKTTTPEESKCQENEVFVECSKKCEQHCHFPVWEGCELQGPCVPRCECKEGYARDREDNCVPEGECLLVPCDDPNEVRTRQGLKDVCRPTCDHRNFTELCNEPTHVSFACECKPGYILDELFGKCVPLSECEGEGMFPSSLWSWG
ncbi:hypothetical protein Y032_0006g3048 [Ancylostoma ceylanicum]|uniref:EGF-like domain-containing protein n=1 Tax=Ancylostoma ceylanicum TaxID=53326 RepID=A0A016VS64_9BILA|nr:hypothetical protein Y032_0006g3048 [Ancylostoma ceylanicum]